MTTITDASDLHEHYRQQRAAAKAAEQAQEERLRLVAAALATGLGDGWSVVPKDEVPTVQVAGPGEARLLLRTERPQPGRLLIRGLYPTQRYGDQAYEIGVGIHRPSEAITAEVQRRLLPDYLKALAVSVQRDVDDLASYRARRDLVTRLGGRMVHDDSPKGSSLEADLPGGDALVRVTTNYAGTGGSLTIRGATAAQLLAVARALRA